MTHRSSVISHPPVHQILATSWPTPIASDLDVASAGSTVQSEDFVTTARALAERLPDDIRHALTEFRAHGHASGAMLIRGVAVGALGETPPSPIAEASKDRVSELSLLSVATTLGEPVGYLPELGGRIVQNLTPVRANATRQTSTSSNVTLMWHTETAFHPYKPRYLVLLCLRGDAHAQTLLCSIDAILGTLDPRTISVLREPRFRIAPDESFLHDGSTAKLGAPTAVLRGTGDDLEFTFDADLMVGMDPQANDALEEIRTRIEREHIGVVLEAGDMLIVDNHRAVHGRSKFAARFDGTDRWLQRTFVVANLDASINDRDGRIITTQF
jgi:L-asparagine oxygenase